MTNSMKKYSMFLAVTILMLTIPLSYQLIIQVNAQPNIGDYIVDEFSSDVLSTITRGGVRTVIHTFAGGTGPMGVAIDSSGNYIVAEYSFDVLSKITPGGARTVIYTFAGGTGPCGVAIDASGNYIVTEGAPNALSKITPGGVRTVIHTFAANTVPTDVAIVTGEAVGGYIMSVNKIAILARYIVIIGLVGTLTIVGVRARRRFTARETT